MRLYLSRHLKHLTATSIALLGTAGTLAGTTGVLASTGAACGCEPPVDLENIAAAEFGKVKINTSQTETFKFVNKKITVKYTSAVLQNTKGMAFTEGSNTCTGEIKAPGSCEIEVTFTPTVSGEEYKANINLQYKANGNGYNESWGIRGFGE